MVLALLQLLVLLQLALLPEHVQQLPHVEVHTAASRTLLFV